MSKNHTMDSNITNPTMSILSQSQQLQNQLQLQQLLNTQQNQQQQIQQQTRSFNSAKSLESAASLVKSSSQGAGQQQLQQKNSLHKDPRDPLSIQIPTTANPTEVLATRFSTWRSIIKALIVYLKEISAVHEEIVRQQIRLQHALSFPFNMQGVNGELFQPFQQQPTSNQPDEVNMASKFFLPLGNGSIQDLPSVLFQFHTTNASMASKIAKELSGSTIPRLEELKRDLLVKIKEIRSLQSDFKNNVTKEQQQSKQELTNFLNAIDMCKSSPSALQPRHDPYLLKISLDRQIRKQLTEENFLHEAYLNLQGSGKELEKVVVIEIQNALTVFAKLLGEEAQTVFDILITKLDSGFLTKDPTFEWDDFILKDANFVDPNLPMRHSSDIVYSHQNDPLSFEIRSGYLERKSKFLKSYSRGWYVLTPTFIHEFKSPDRKKDPYPVMTLSVDDCQVAEHSKKDNSGDSWSKFVLHTKQNGLIHRGHNWVFRADSYESMISWYNDIKKLTSLPTPVSRAQIVASKKNPSVKKSSITSKISAPSSMQSKKGDTVLSIPVSNAHLPNKASSPIPKNMVGQDAVITIDQESNSSNNNNINENNSTNINGQQTQPSSSGFQTIEAEPHTQKEEGNGHFSRISQDYSRNNNINSTTSNSPPENSLNMGMSVTTVSSDVDRSTLSDIDIRKGGK